MATLLFSLLLLLLLPFTLVTSQPPPPPPGEPSPQVDWLADGLKKLKPDLSATKLCHQPGNSTVQTGNLTVGCFCSANGCVINNLTASGSGLSGTIPDEFYDLTELVYLDLSNNLLNGVINPRIGNLTQLRYLNLSINNLNGPLPSAIGNLTSLNYLDLSINNLNGSLPSAIGSLTSLNFLYLSVNNFSGELPQELGNLQSLHILHFDSNPISGAIRNFSNLINLSSLWAFDTRINEMDPSTFDHLNGLQDLRIYGTLLNGNLSLDFSSLQQLQYLLIGGFYQNNSFDDFNNLRRLEVVSLRDCTVNSNISRLNIPGLQNMKYLDLSFTNISGNLSNALKQWQLLGNGHPSSLKFLNLGSNQLTGTLKDDDLHTFFPNASIDLSYNFLLNGCTLETQNVNYIATELMPCNETGSSKIVSSLNCLLSGSSCSSNFLNLNETSFAVNCGGGEQKYLNYMFFNDSTDLGAADFFVDIDNHWIVSNVGSDPFNLNKSTIVSTNQQIQGAGDSFLYNTSRTSTSSLRYYAMGLANGHYHVAIHFAEIVIDSKIHPHGKRLFDIKIQDQIVAQDFDIIREAGGSFVAVQMNYNTNVTDSILSIHFYWAGRGTCCIPVDGTYGPLVSAISASLAPPEPPTPSPMTPNQAVGNDKRPGVIFGISALSFAGVVIFLSAVYLWWKWVTLVAHPKV